MLTCRQLAEDLSSDAGHARGWRYRLKMRLHALICPPCRTYVRQLESISAGAKHACEEHEPSAAKLAEMQDRCLMKLSADKVSGPGKTP